MLSSSNLLPQTCPSSYLQWMKSCIGNTWIGRNQQYFAYPLAVTDVHLVRNVQLAKRDLDENDHGWTKAGPYLVRNGLWDTTIKSLTG